MIERKKRIMMMQKSDALPSEYTKVAYIRNDGTQFINTDYIPHVAPLIKTRMRIDSNADRDCFGFINNVFPSFIVDCNNGTWYNRWGKTNYVSVNCYHYNEIHDWEFGQITKMDGNTFKEFEDCDWSSNTQSMYLFRGRNVSLGLSIFNCQLYDGNTMVRNFIPCIRKSDNKPGMYDTVSKTFYTNAGTGEFIVPA